MKLRRYLGLSLSFMQLLLLSNPINLKLKARLIKLIYWRVFDAALGAGESDERLAMHYSG